MNVVFTRGKTLLSRIICGLTGSEFSHVAIEHEGVVLESNLLGVRLTPIASFLGHSEIKKSILIRKPDVGRLLRFYAARQARQYDWGAFFYLGLYLAWARLTGQAIRRRNLWRATGAYLCTELVHEYLTGHEGHFLTPQELYDHLSRRQG